jgi:hypothetical protein
VAVFYETAFAFGAFGVGDEPGDGPVGSTLVAVLGGLAIAAGAVLAGLALLPDEPAPRHVVALIPLGAAAFVVARFLTPDPYYAPTVRRLSDGGAFSASWIFVWTGLAVVAAALIMIRRRVGLATAVPVLLVLAVTGLAEASGH